MSLIIVDGPFLTYRAFSVGGASAVRGSAVKTLLRLLWTPGADLWVVWEGRKGSNFRFELFPDYKARREAKPDEYRASINELQATLPFFGIGQAWPKSGEADDAAATMAASTPTSVTLWACDKDWLQLVTPGVSIYQDTHKRLVTVDNIVELTGLSPRGWLDYQTLAGDSGDDIPGLPGIADRRARDLLAACPDVVDLLLADKADDARQIVASHDAASMKWLEVAAMNIDLLFLTRELVRLRDDIELHKVPPVTDIDRASEWLRANKMEQFIERLPVSGPSDPWMQG